MTMREIRVGPFAYEILWDAGEAAKLAVEMKESALIAGVKLRDMQIVIDPSFPDDRTRNSVLHEVLHAALNAAGLNLDAEPNGITEEDLVVTLTPWLLMVIRDNPHLVKYLQRGGD